MIRKKINCIDYKISKSYLIGQILLSLDLMELEDNAVVFVVVRCPITGLALFFFVIGSPYRATPTALSIL